MAKLQYYSMKSKIDYFRGQGKEGPCWDFKQEWHSQIEDLIKDIICFANTVHDEDCYLIFGVADDLSVTGMRSARRKQADIIDAISKLNFAGDNPPQIAVDTLHYEGETIDVLTVRNNNMTPLYLNKRYGKMLPGCIYARVEDRNTPNESCALISEIELLWKKRLGLTKPPLQFIFDHLHSRIEWVEDDNKYYNIYRPEYTIEIVDDEDRDSDEFYFYAMTNEAGFFSELRILYHQTVLKTFQVANLDSGARLRCVIPTWGFVCHDEYGMHAEYCYKYYIQGSDEDVVREFLYDPHNDESRIAWSNLSKVVVLYQSEEERLAFEAYIEKNQPLVATKIACIDRFDYINAGTDTKTAEYKKRLRTGLALNELLKEYRKENKQD